MPSGDTFCVYGQGYPACKGTDEDGQRHQQTFYVVLMSRGEIRWDGGERRAVDSGTSQCKERPKRQ
jgi:hypothetical protein